MKQTGNKRVGSIVLRRAVAVSVLALAGVFAGLCVGSPSAVGASKKASKKASEAQRLAEYRQSLREQHDRVFEPYRQAKKEREEQAQREQEKRLAEQKRKDKRAVEVARANRHEQIKAKPGAVERLAQEYGELQKGHAKTAAALRAHHDERVKAQTQAAAAAAAQGVKDRFAARVREHDAKQAAKFAAEATEPPSEAELRRRELAQTRQEIRQRHDQLSESWRKAIEEEKQRLEEQANKEIEELIEELEAYDLALEQTEEALILADTEAQAHAEIKAVIAAAGTQARDAIRAAMKANLDRMATAATNGLQRLDRQIEGHSADGKKLKQAGKKALKATVNTQLANIDTTAHAIRQLAQQQTKRWETKQDKSTASQLQQIRNTAKTQIATIRAQREAYRQQEQQQTQQARRQQATAAQQRKTQIAAEKQRAQKERAEKAAKKRQEDEAVRQHLLRIDPPGKDTTWGTLKRSVDIGTLFIPGAAPLKVALKAPKLVKAARATKAAITGGRGAKTAGTAATRALSKADKSKILGNAARGKGKHNLGSATSREADALGLEWVGKGYTVETSASGGKRLVSRDGLRQYRAPERKDRLGRHQANFERKVKGQKSGEWQGNGHLDITDAQ